MQPKMSIGVCSDISNADFINSIGFDFIELNVQRDLVPESDESVFTPILKRLSESPIRVLAANCLFPGSIKLTGPDVDFSRITEYLESAFERAHRAGMTIIVFGAGGARAVPDGFNREKALEQLVHIGSMMGSIAAKNDILVVVEPLNPDECNILNTVDETGKYIRYINHKNIRLLVDSFHWSKNDLDTKSIVENGELIKHVHIATYASRMFPGAEPCDFSQFFESLKKSGYIGPISVESFSFNLTNEGAIAVDLLQHFLK